MNKNLKIKELENENMNLINQLSQLKTKYFKLKIESPIIARKNKIIEAIENRIIKELNIMNIEITDNLIKLIEKYNELIKG